MIRVFVLFFSIFTATQAAGPMNMTKEKQDSTAILTFGLIADIQYCDCESHGTRYFSHSLNKLTEAIDDFNNSEAEFIINMGDLIERDFRSFGPVLELMRKSKRAIFHLPGNHDYSVRQRYKKRVTRMLAGEDGYYSFSKGGFRFIALNSCDISTYSGSLRSRFKAGAMLARLQREGQKNAFDWNGAIGRKQISWFKSELAEAREMGQGVFIFSHHPLAPEGAHNIYNREEMLEIVSAYDNIIAWFCGHNHEGDYGYYNDIHFVTLKAMVETANTNSWALVEVYENYLLMKGRGREESRKLTY
ncbi:MAG: metallophosphoesterase [Bacteroidales bacterium]|jgi:3',5'-cyclic AMP phosphodiesterase CpdA|nr:metallophosphoesterase [Bacteroidales bacterium]